MDNSQDIRIVLGSQRYKGASDTNLSIDFSLEQTTKFENEYDRSQDISLSQVYTDERESSNLFRPSCKFMVLFKNSYIGTTNNYSPFENNLYYVNQEYSARLQCNTNVDWSGLPQYNEFDFIRTDYQVSGYTAPPNEHLKFTPLSASSYNWNFYLSYPIENDYDKNLQAVDEKTNTTLNWKVSDGIPFIIENVIINGSNLVSFRCPVKHGLTTENFVKLSFSYRKEDIFSVHSLGDGVDGSEDFIFNVFNNGFTGSTFNDGVTGTFKRVLNPDNTGDTISKYYVRKHIILNDENEYALTKAGFEYNIFRKVVKYESSAYTPNYQSRLSTLEDGQSYTLSFNKDFDITKYRDNQNRPLSQLFFSVVWKGYFGWTSGQLKQGYEFNLPLNNFTKYPNNWWSTSNSNSNFTFGSLSWTRPIGNKTFNYVRTPKSGEKIDGDLCEWNDYEQIERVVSNLYHKFVYNQQYFKMNPIPPGYLVNPNALPQFGYYYQPHYPMDIRIFSDYIETAPPPPSEIDNLPSYAYFSDLENNFLWRDLYSYGYTDSQGRGVQFPFTNGRHYPNKNIVFRIIPEGTNYNTLINSGVINDPLVDNCE